MFRNPYNTQFFLNLNVISCILTLGASMHQAQSALHETYFRKNVRVEVEVDEGAKAYGEWGIVTALDEKAKTVSILTEKQALTIELAPVKVRTVRECSVRPYFNFSRLPKAKIIYNLWFQWCCKFTSVFFHYEHYRFSRIRHFKWSRTSKSRPSYRY